MILSYKYKYKKYKLKYNILKGGVLTHKKNFNIIVLGRSLDDYFRNIQNNKIDYIFEEYNLLKKNCDISLEDNINKIYLVDNAVNEFNCSNIINFIQSKDYSKISNILKISFDDDDYIKDIVKTFFNLPLIKFSICYKSDFVDYFSY